MRPDPSRRRRGPSAARWAVLALSAGCATNTIDVEAEDDAVTMPALRAVYQLSEAREQGVGEGARVGSAVELEVALAEGDDTQAFGSGERIEFGALDVVGPGTALVDAELAFGSLCFRGDLHLNPRFTLQALAGLGWQRADTEVRVGAARGHDRDSSIGFKFGGRAVLHATQELDLRLGLAQVVGLHSADTLALSDVQLDARLRAAEHLSLFAGWRWLGYEQERGGESDLDLAFAGPTFGLQLEF